MGHGFQLTGSTLRQPLGRLSPTSVSIASEQEPTEADVNVEAVSTNEPLDLSAVDDRSRVSRPVIVIIS